MTRGQRWFIRIRNVVVGVALGLYFVHIMTAGLPSTEAPATKERTVTIVDRAEKLVERHACWQGSDEPLAPLPNAAVVSRDGRARYTTNPRLVDLAFGEALGTPSPEVDVVALCIEE